MIKILRSEKIDGIYEKVDLIFKLLFLSVSLLSYNSFAHGTPITSVLIVIMVAFAGLLLIYKLFNWRHFIKNRFLWLIFAFLASYALSTLVNYKYGLWEPLKTAVWISMQYLLLFATDDRKTVNGYKKQLNTVFAFYSVYIVFANIVSLFLLIIRYSSEKSDFKTYGGAIAGFTRGRLWGVYTDPNVGAVMTVIAVFIAIYFLSIASKKWQKTGLIISIIINFLYISFADSRTSFVAIAVAGTVAMYMLLFIKKSVKKPALRQVMCLSLALLITFGCLVSLKLVKTGYKRGYELLMQALQASDEEMEQFESAFDSRENDISSDVSNQRFDLWGASIEMFLKTPVVGTSFENFAAYAKENIPESFLIKDKEVPFDRFHNMLFDILAAQGIIGIAIFLTLAATSGITAVKRTIKSLKTENAVLYICMLGLLLTALCGAMFTSDLVYINTPVAAIFWYALGIILIKPEKKGV